MRLSNSARLFKLVTHLASNPDLLPPYVKHNVLSKKFPIDLELPWWSYRAIDYVDKIIPNKRIFEYGSGGSTIRFAKKAKSILATENDTKWIQFGKEKLEKN
ncbi:hypothetical protein GCM10027299_09320 [Larkinella ripae]